MNATPLSLQHLAEVGRALGVPPSLLFVQPIDTVLEVEARALEFSVRADLPPVDRAILGLTIALGRVGEGDVVRWLGLGPDLSSITLRRLHGEGLLGATEGPADVNDGFAHRVFDTLGLRLAEADFSAPATVRARPVGEAPSVGVEEQWAITAAGRAALAAGFVPRRRIAGARLLFNESPLHFLGSVREHQNATKRPLFELQPQDVPGPFRALDVLLTGPAEDRYTRCGVPRTLHGHDGDLVGVVPGQQWIVRQRTEGAIPRWVPSMFVVGVGYSAGDELRWGAFTRSDKGIEMVERKALVATVSEALLPSGDFKEEIARACSGEVESHPGPGSTAWRVRMSGEQVAQHLGDGVEPAEVYVRLPPIVPGWDAYARVRAIPRESQDARDAFMVFLTRRVEDLRGGLRGAIARGWGALCGWWAPATFEAAPIESLYAALWSRVELRDAVCRERLADDLIHAYEEGGR